MKGCHSMAKKRRYPGCFVVIEGATGVGKTYFAEKLSLILNEQFGYTIKRLGGFIKTDEKELSHITRLLKEFMRQSRFINLPWLCETTLLFSEQAHNIDEFLIPSLASRKVVLYENYDDALYAYQMARGLAINIPMKELDQVLKKLTSFQYKPFSYPKPDILVYIKSPLNLSLERLNQREPRPVSKEDKNMIKIIKNNYEELYRKRKKVIIINNTKNADINKEAIKVAQIIKKKADNYYA